MIDVSRWIPLIANHDRLFSEKLQVQDSCLVYTGFRNHDGYGKVLRGGKARMAHRYIWTQLNGDIPADMCVCHSCDNPSCCNPDHLFLGSHSDNMRDMKAKGRGNWPGKKGKAGLCGGLNPKAKLTKQNVEWIRSNHSPQYGSPMGTTALAKKFDVDRNTILAVLKRKTWRGL